MNIKIIEPAKEKIMEVHHVRIDLDALIMTCGELSFPASKDLITELEKCINTELPKDTKYIEHDTTALKDALDLRMVKL